MPSQDTSTPASTSTPSCGADLPALYNRLQALDSDLAQHRLSIAYALDELGTALEHSRQVRQQILALMAREVRR